MQPKTHTFAGFSYPRPLAVMPHDTLSARLNSRRKVNASRVAAGLEPRATATTGGYYLTGAVVDRSRSGHSFYLDDAGMPAKRFALAHEVAAARVKHSGWYLDDCQDETVCGLVLYLSGGRMLAGWTYGAGMASAVDTREVYTDACEAAHAADEMARQVAEDERERRTTDGAGDCCPD